MSFAHVRLNKIKQNEFLVEYIVESFDFNNESEWEEIGKLEINIIAKSYDFWPAKIWSSLQIIPPPIYGLDETKREQIIKSKYRDYGWGAWSMLIHHWAVSFIKQDSFPEYHPSSFFPTRKPKKLVANKMDKRQAIAY